MKNLKTTKTEWDLSQLSQKYLDEKVQDLSSHMNKVENLLWDIKQESNISDELYKVLANSTTDLRHKILNSLNSLEAKNK